MNIKTLIKVAILRIRYSDAYIAWSANVSLDTIIAGKAKILSNCFISRSRLSRYSYIGQNGNFSNTSVGPFTSIGSDVICGLGRHPVDFASTYPGFYSKSPSGSHWLGFSHGFEENRPVVIGADVWIGTRAVILGGVSIGHGAVVAAGAVVSKNVEPYSIVAGVPARHIRYRFTQPIINEMLLLKWWDMQIDMLGRAAEFANDPEVFLKVLSSNKMAT